MANFFSELSTADSMFFPSPIFFSRNKILPKICILSALPKVIDRIGRMKRVEETRRRPQRVGSKDGWIVILNAKIYKVSPELSNLSRDTYNLKPHSRSRRKGTREQRKVKGRAIIFSHLATLFSKYSPSKVNRILSRVDCQLFALLVDRVFERWRGNFEQQPKQKFGFFEKEKDAKCDGRRRRLWKSN